MATLSDETIERIVELRKTGLSFSEISKKLGIAKSSVSKYLNKQYPIKEETYTLLEKDAKKVIKENIQFRARSEIIATKCMEAISGLKIKPIPVKMKADKKSMTDMHQLISDIQIGQYTDPELTAGLAKYSYKDFVSHTEQLLNKIILFKDIYGKVNMRRLVLNFLGDIVEGETIFPGQAHYIDQCVVDQLFFGLGHIISMIQTLASEFPQVEIYGVWGNHGRLGKKGYNHARSNFDYIFYKCIQQAFEQQSNVNVYVSKSPLMLVRHGNYNFCLFHGDSVNSWMGIPYYGLDRMARNLHGLTNMIINYVLVGHFHRDAAISLPANGRLLANGCWPGGSLLSVTKMFEASIPRQTMYLFHDEEGVHSVNDLRLGKLPRLEVGEGGIYYPVEE